MRPLASNIGDTCDDMLGQLVLDVEVPLLNIGPTRLGIDGIETEREGSDGSPSSSPDARIVLYIRLGWIQHQRRGGLQCFDTLFVAVPVFEEDTVTSAHGPFAIAPGVLKVRLDDFVAEIIFGCKTHLLIAGNPSHKKVGKRIVGGHPTSVVEGQEALDRTETALLVLLSQDTIEPKLQSVNADDFGYVVP